MLCLVFSHSLQAVGLQQAEIWSVPCLNMCFSMGVFRAALTAETLRIGKSPPAAAVLGSVWMGAVLIYYIPVKVIIWWNYSYHNVVELMSAAVEGKIQFITLSELMISFNVELPSCKRRMVNRNVLFKVRVQTTLPTILSQNCGGILDNMILIFSQESFVQWLNAAPSEISQMLGLSVRCVCLNSGSEGTTKPGTAITHQNFLVVCFAKSVCIRTLTTISWSIHPCAQLFYLPSSLRSCRCGLNAAPVVYAVSFANVTSSNWPFTSSPFTDHFFRLSRDRFDLPCHKLEQKSHMVRRFKAVWERLLLRLAVLKGVTLEGFRIYGWLSGPSRLPSLSQIKKHPILTWIHMSDQPSLGYLCHPRGETAVWNAYRSF